LVPTLLLAISKELVGKGNIQLAIAADELLILLREALELSKTRHRALLEAPLNHQGANALMSCEGFHRVLGKPRDREFSVAGGQMFSLHGHIVPIGGKTKPFYWSHGRFCGLAARRARFAISLICLASLPAFGRPYLAHHIQANARDGFYSCPLTRLQRRHANQSVGAGHVKYNVAFRKVNKRQFRRLAR
jgi:hypothetical protein